ncbi:hypothetical protein RFI_26385 [Reticulomyxa filosa]|uniref:Uncharacterized protein n=1 Tax=Reticulomyxa filosa TaxID=46433 RepID=X6MBF4_RETFI|nr:hypothetical protein RFI_26385 [Reticulomyxa filosa]|eukprot:ETO10991.1 hypothetical protein RFI_26385 [Reticulomyxa filosa]
MSVPKRPRPIDLNSDRGRGDTGLSTLPPSKRQRLNETTGDNAPGSSDQKSKVGSNETETCDLSKVFSNSNEWSIPKNMGLLKKLNEQLTMSTELYGLDHMSGSEGSTRGGGNMPMKQGKIFVMLEWLFSRMDKDDFMDIWPFEELNHLLSDCMAYLMDTSRVIHKCQSLMGLLASSRSESMEELSRPQEFDVETIQHFKPRKKT